MQNEPRESRAEPGIPPPLGIVRQPTQHDPRLDSKILSAVARIAPGTELRSAIDDIIRSSEGALIVIGETNELAFLFSGGIKLDVPFRPQLLYELAKMDGAIIVNSPVTKLSHANVQLMPDPTIPSAETGTRHRTAERVAKQTDALVISISQQRETVTVFVGHSRYQLETIADVLAKTNQVLEFELLAVLGFPASTNPLDYSVTPRGYRVLSHIPRLPDGVVKRVVSNLEGLEGIVSASQRELEAVEGVGTVRAREIREGLRRLREHNLVDRYLQL